MAELADGPNKLPEKPEPQTKKRSVEELGQSYLDTTIGQGRESKRPVIGTYLDRAFQTVKLSPIAVPTSENCESEISDIQEPQAAISPVVTIQNRASTPTFNPGDSISNDPRINKPFFIASMSGGGQLNPKPPQGGTEETLTTKNFTEYLKNELGENNKVLVELVHNIMQEFTSKVTSLETKVGSLETKVQRLEEDNFHKDLEIERIKYRQDTNDQLVRRNGFKIAGIPETEDEDITKVVEDVFKVLDDKFDMSKVTKVKRTGRGAGPNPRPVLVKFRNSDARDHLFFKRKTLATSGNAQLKTIYINDDLAPVRSKILYNVRMMKNGGLINKYWVFGSEVWCNYEEEGDRHKVTGYVLFKDKEDPMIAQIWGINHPTKNS
jgi:regulator of replication initiation timing